MFDQKEHPVMILIPGNEVTDREGDKDYSEIGKYKVEQQGENVAILALGDFYQMGESLAAAIKLEKKFYDRYNPAELLKELGMTNETMVEEIRNKMV